MASTKRILPEPFVESIRIEGRRLNATRITVFGSATFQGLSARDVDLLVVSDTFYDVPYQDRREMVNLPPGPIYDVWCLTSAEFADRRHTFLMFQTGLAGREVDLWP